jgi:hypothetical protein
MPRQAFQGEGGTPVGGAAVEVGWKHLILFDDGVELHSR